MDLRSKVLELHQHSQIEVESQAGNAMARVMESLEPSTAEDAGRDLEATLRIWETSTAVKPFTPRGFGGLGLTSQNVEDAAHRGLTEIQKKGLAAFEQMSLSKNPRSNLPSKPKALRDGTILPSATAQRRYSNHPTFGVQGSHKKAGKTSWTNQSPEISGKSL